MAVDIPLRNRHGDVVAVALVDDCDADLAERRWSLLPCGYAMRTVYSNGRSRTVYLHRIVLERKLGRPIAEGMTTDHANGDKLDNRRPNLREATRRQQEGNKRLVRTNTSGYRGVSRHRGKWRAQASVRMDGRERLIHLGLHATREDAARAWDRWAVEHFGPGCARLNFPDAAVGALPPGLLERAESAPAA